MAGLNDFFNLISESKKESENKIGDNTIENLSDKLKENLFSTHSRILLRLARGCLIFRQGFLRI
mgnify:CR=1 FL=1